MQVTAVFHDEYCGTKTLVNHEVPDGATPQQIWESVTNIPATERGPSEGYQEGYLEDWDAYGSHHKGMITRIWWGDGALENARHTYDQIDAPPGDGDER